VALANSERDASLAAAGADYAQAIAVAGAVQAAGLAQAAAAGALGGSSKAALPSLSEVTASATQYAIPAAPASDYAVYLQPSGYWDCRDARPGLGWDVAA
jgi:hypothetical protein